MTPVDDPRVLSATTRACTVGERASVNQRRQVLLHKNLTALYGNR
jgi:hypothetical protein